MICECCMVYTSDKFTAIWCKNVMCLNNNKIKLYVPILGVLSGLRKMVSGSVNTPATVNENGKTPVLSKSAAKRKFDSYEGLSAKTK